MAKKLKTTDEQEPDINPALADSTADPVEALKAELAEAKALLADAEAERMVAHQQEAEARKRVDKLIVELAAVEPPQTTANAIREYIDRQNEVRAERAAQRNALIGAGIDPEELQAAIAPLTGILRHNRHKAKRAEQFAAYRGA